MTLDVSENIGALTIDNATATLLLNSGNTLFVTSAAGQSGTAALTAGTITLASGTLEYTDTLANSGTISGVGGLTGQALSHLSGSGVILASGGTLDVFSTVDAGVTGLEIAFGSANTLRFDGSVAAGDLVTFEGPTGLLQIATTRVLRRHDCPDSRERQRPHR